MNKPADMRTMYRNADSSGGTMKPLNTWNRRDILKTGAAALGAAALPSMKVSARPEGKFRLVALMGDYWHNPIALETHIRQIFSGVADISFCQAGRFLTPELIEQADLLVTERWEGTDSQGWNPNGVVDSRPAPDKFMTDEQEEAIVTGIRDRGMGWLACHCSFWNQRPRIKALLGCEPILHQEIQPLYFHDFETNHPITRGIESFTVNLDEQFDALMTDTDNTVLFRTTALHDKRVATSGWCREYGSGRFVALLPGHTQWAWKNETYQEIVWRAGYWAMQKTIPPFNATT